MTCTACGEHPKENTAKGFPKAVVEINNPETLVLLRKVVIPASMGDETAFPPAIGKYFNVLLHYEASGNSYLYSSDGIPTEIGANIPQELLDRIEALEDGYDDLAEDYEQLQSEVGDLSEDLSAETSARELADGNLQSQVGDVSEALSAETSARRNADIGLQGQIDAITSSSDVKDIVGTYTELQNYDTSTLGNDDIIKVLQDSTHNNAMTYYRWIISGGAGSWQYIGEEGPYYTKSETETLLNNKQDEITSSNKLLSDLVDDTNQTNKFVTENEKTTWNTEIENLQEEDELLKRNLQTTTGSGEEVTLEKTAELDFVKPPLPRGNTKQDTTTGKNLWDDGIVTVAPSDKVIKNNNEYLFGLMGQSTSEVITLPFILNEDHTYTISFDAYADEDGTRLMIDGNPDSIYNAQGIPDIAISISSQSQRISRTISLLNGNTAVRLYRTSAHPKAATSRIYLSNIQLEEGSTATDYEPYTGGIPSPNPSYPQEVEVVTGNVGVTISNENNTESKTLPVSLGNIELCKIGNYQDYLYKDNGKWYKYGAIGKLTITSISSVGTASTGIKYALVGSVSIASASSFIYCSKYINSTSATKNNSIRLSGANLYVYDNRLTDYTTALNLLNGLEYYCVLATPTITEITDTTLISQLEEISKTLSYQGQTNITSNTIALFDVEAYQSTKLILEDLDLTKLSTFDSTKTQILKNINGTLTWVDE